MAAYDVTVSAHHPSLAAPADLPIPAGAVSTPALVLEFPDVQADTRSDALNQVVAWLRGAGYTPLLTPDQEEALHQLKNRRAFIAQQMADPAFRERQRAVRNEARFADLYAGAVMEPFHTTREEWEFHARYYPASVIARLPPPPEE